MKVGMGTTFVNSILYLYIRAAFLFEYLLLTFENSHPFPHEEEVHKYRCGEMLFVAMSRVSF